MVVLDWDMPITLEDDGFPKVRGGKLTEAMKCNWAQPPYFEDGTLQLRAEIRDQPEPQDMRLQFCIWQNIEGETFRRESCSSRQKVVGTPENVVEWEQALRLGNIDWSVPRTITGLAIKNSLGCPVSTWNFKEDELPSGCPLTDGDPPVMVDWADEDPYLWYHPVEWYDNPDEYPVLDMRFTAVIVAPDAEFPGWEVIIGAGE